ncbi:MAG: hypothetical protein A2219_07550 [Elusimicrobia bacterium RIFOXYA2_FULL_50_26]|nr:MAG: hypothetical protein A2219_07550 [Elusimicrobia bacterium RIFOXYA2_FULL_50_26]
MSLRQNIEDVFRLRQILQALAVYGFGRFAARLDLERRFMRRAAEKSELKAMSDAVRLRLMLEELGPTFIKFGQMLSMRPDILPYDVITELEKLQDQVPAFDYAIVREEISRGLGRAVEELFRSFTPEPAACASLSQVHRAELFSGERVMVKVQRPGIERIIRDDLDILSRLARLSRRYFPRPLPFDPAGLVAEFESAIAREIDFANEADAMEKFSRQFSGDETVVIPRVYRAFSGKRVVTMELISGIKISDIAAIEKAGLDRRKIAYNGSGAILRQIFLNGFFHADPHPGNMLVLSGNRIAFIDFGMVGRLTREMRARLADMLIFIVRKNIHELRESFLSLATAREAVNNSLFDYDLEDFVERYHGLPLKEINPGLALSGLFNLAARHSLIFPSDLLLLSKALITAEEVGRKMDPDFSMTARATPFIEQVRKERYSAEAMIAGGRRLATSLLRFAGMLPRELGEILHKIKQGTLKIEFEHMGLENLTGEIDRASNRLSFSLIIAGLVVSSSVIVHANRGPTYFGLPLLGLAGYIAAFALGIWLIISIIRSGHL